MRIQNQIIVEWTIVRHYDDVSFAQRLGQVVKLQEELLKEGEAMEIHQVAYAGEFEKEKKYIIILNIVPQKTN
ncbi:MAG: hypothetical protein ACQEWF_23240 [Bacillota bacterium]